MQQELLGIRELISARSPHTVIVMANNPSDPSYDDLSIFLDICRTGGFRATAKRLGLSPSSVSEKVALLERQIGVPLLTRTTRSVIPTDAGRKLAERLSPLYDDARAALEDAKSSHDEVRGTLRLNVTGAVMDDIIPPIVDRFLRCHPGVRFEFVVEDRLVDALASGCDAGIRYVEHLARDMIAVPVGPKYQTAGLAASPDYLARAGIPQHPDELASFSGVRLRYSSGSLVDWEFERDGTQLVASPDTRLTVGVDAAQAAIGFARAGHGLIYTFENWLTPHFSSGELVPVLRDWWLTFEGPRLYFPCRFKPAPLRAFVDFIRATESA